MASISKNPFTDMPQTHAKFANTSGSSSCSLHPAQLEGTTCCKGTLCFPPLSQKHESFCQNHRPARRREGEMPLAGWSLPGLRRTSRLGA